MKSEAPLIPSRQIGNRQIHRLTHRTHAHQVKQGQGRQWCQPERQPVVGEVDHRLKAGPRPLQHRPAPEGLQQAIGRHRDRGTALLVLGAGLGAAATGPKLGG